MTVYVLFYNYYEDSIVKGVFSFSGKEKKMLEFAQLGKDMIAAEMPELENTLDYYLREAKDHFRKSDTLFREGTKESRHDGKKEQTLGLSMKYNAESYQEKIQKYKNYTDKDFANYYLESENLSFMEFELNE